MPPKVYVILVNYEHSRDTIECLESVLRMEYAHFRVLVVDNGSEDDSLPRLRAWAAGRNVFTGPVNPALGSLFAQLLTKPLSCAECDAANADAAAVPDAAVTVLRLSPNAGCCGGNNAALRFALARGDGEYVWLVNNDAVVAADAMEKLVEAAQADERAGILGSKVLEYDRPDTIQLLGGGTFCRWRGQTRHAWRGQPDAEDVPIPALDFICGVSMLVRLSVLEDVGLLNERFFLYGEDLDLCLRARRRGWKVAAVPASRVWHKAGATTRHGSPLQDYYTVRNSLLAMRIHHPAWLPVAATHLAIRSILPKVVRFQGARLAAVLRAFADAIRGRFGKG